eukprot:m.242433 g.242433  ORF g.242433 m.242433 type:complete len:345 (+) comp25678_c0_seq1:37-1071(+)
MPSIARFAPRFLSFFGILVGFFVSILVVKRFVYVDTMIPEVYPCLLHGWKENANLNRKVWDAFPFGGELDILDARLNELNEVVDRFVIVESAETFSGHRKPLHFALHQDRFEKFKDKIVYVQLPDIPPPEDRKSVEEQMAWRREQQKNGLFEGLRGAAEHDLVIVSDVDEIPRAAVVRQLRMCEGYTLPVELHMTHFMYDFACPEQRLWFAAATRRAKIVQKRQLTTVCDGAWDGRACIEELQGNQNLGLSLFQQPTSVINAGWHLAYFMPAQAIQDNVHAKSVDLALSSKQLDCMIYRCRQPDGSSFGVRTRSSGEGPAWVRAKAAEGDQRYVQFYLRTLSQC